MDDSRGRAFSIILPLAALVTVILFSMAFFSPNIPTPNNLAHIIISPSTALQAQTQAPTTRPPDGPTVWLGIFGSCAQSSKNVDITCTSMGFNPTYDFSVLPPNAPTYVLLSPPAHYKLFGYIAFGLWPILFLMATMICWRVIFGHWVERWFLDIPLFFWLGLFVGVVGGVNSWILNLYFDNICLNFNDFVARQGANGPHLIASHGDSFIFGYVACIVFFFPWLFLSAHIHKDQVSSISVAGAVSSGKPVGQSQHTPSPFSPSTLGSDKVGLEPGKQNIYWVPLSPSRFPAGYPVRGV